MEVGEGVGEWKVEVGGGGVEEGGGVEVGGGVGWRGKVEGKRRNGEDWLGCGGWGVGE